MYSLPEKCRLYEIPEVISTERTMTYSLPEWGTLISILSTWDAMKYSQPEVPWTAVYEKYPTVQSTRVKMKCSLLEVLRSTTYLKYHEMISKKISVELNRPSCPLNRSRDWTELNRVEVYLRNHGLRYVCNTIRCRLLEELWHTVYPGYHEM